MKKKLSVKALLGICLPFMAVILALIIGLAAAAATYKETISRFLYGVGGDVDKETLAEGSELCEKIGNEGVVLLKNQNNTLPLTEVKKVNVFGWAAFDWVTGGYGSGFSNTELERLKLFPALKKAGIEYNTTLETMYSDFYKNPAKDYGGPWDEYRGDVSVSGNNKYTLHEPGATYYTDAVISEARAFSDVALVVIGRVGGEGKDLRKYQEKQEQKNKSNTKIKDTTRHYLELSTEEEEMIAAAKKACDKVIVVLNTANAMELGFLNDEGIDACLLAGLTGLTGVNAVINILKGDVNPSGRTADIFAKDFTRLPVFVNSGYGDGTDGALKCKEATVAYGSKGYFDAYVDYAEDIYTGYRYFETFASSIGTLSAVNQEKVYNAFVQYPFGYGLSYTDFKWSVTSVSPNVETALEKDGKIEVKIKVENVGERAGKEVVQLYYAAPYTKGGIEKPATVLGAFAKTGVIEPQGSETVTLSMNVRDMASYDCYDKNGNGHRGYELDGGDYFIQLKENSHKLKENIGTDSKTGAQIKFTVPQGGYQYATDGVTGNTVENRFTGATAEDGIPIDGSQETTPVTYLSRANNMISTLPKVKARRNRSKEAYDVSKLSEPTAEQIAGLGIADMPTLSSGGTKTINDAMSSKKYEDDIYGELLDQTTSAELFRLVRDGYFKTAAIDSIGKPEYSDLDGPAGLNTRIFSNNKCKYVLYPNETLLAQTWNVDLAYQMGLSAGKEAKDSGVKGWYAPGANIHRSPFGGRNFEYYSEDPLLSGKMTAEVVRGAKNNGLYCYIKHFVVNETETMREGLFTWLTEQDLREIYLKTFEIAVKEGGANAIMTSMNRVGAVWAGASRALCTDILRTEWGFNGSLVTDWVDVGSTYMPVYKGLYAGNDIWLNNAEANRLFSDSAYANDKTFVTLAKNAAHNVLYTLISTEQAKNEYALSQGETVAPGQDITNQETKYNYTWVTYLVIVEVALAGGLAVWVALLTRTIIKRNKAVLVDENKE